MDHQQQNYQPMDGGVETPIFNSPDLPETFRSFIARPDELEIADPLQSYEAEGVIVNEQDGPDEDFNPVEPMPESLNSGLRMDAMNTRSHGFKVKRDDVAKDLKGENIEELYENNFRKIRSAKRAKKSILSNPSNSYINNNGFKKVQVTEEETGTQRVQVNAGYENPRITCVTNYNSCSGVLLKFVLTFYGTNDGKDTPCDL